MDATEQELEAFRRQWRDEVSAKAKGKQPSSRKNTQNKGPDLPSYAHRHSEDTDARTAASHVHADLQVQVTDTHHVKRLDEPAPASAGPSEEPQSALEHYEKAVEKETQGSLGDSLNLYRKAFKLDDSVHEKYKAKHFPPKPAQPKPNPRAQDPSPSSTPATAPSTTQHSSHGLQPSLQSMIEDFATCSILGEEPPTDLSPSPPCPIAFIPEEILVEILEHVAVQDVASFARLSQVCRRLAYLVATEERVWKRIALGHEYGFAAMHYTWSCQVDGRPLGDDGEGGYILGPEFEDPIVATPPPQDATALLVPSPYPTFRTLFHRRPRIRFNGCYISTVNYTRPGAASPTSITWNSPIHIVTYYRYLRFLRDGTCISLLTTSEPVDVVPFLYVEHMHKNHHSLPSAPMKDALLGRWRLTGPQGLGAEGAEKEGTLEIETAGATPKYMYKMYLGIGTAGRAARSNKLAWQGYWSYNRLTDDWAEFGLKNDRSFYWSRVKSYGMSWNEGGMRP